MDGSRLGNLCARSQRGCFQAGSTGRAAVPSASLGRSFRLYARTCVPSQTITWSPKTIG